MKAFSPKPLYCPTAWKESQDGKHFAYAARLVDQRPADTDLKWSVVIDGVEGTGNYIEFFVVVD